MVWYITRDTLHKDYCSLSCVWKSAIIYWRIKVKVFFCSCLKLVILSSCFSWSETCRRWTFCGRRLFVAPLMASYTLTFPDPDLAFAGQPGSRASRQLTPNLVSQACCSLALARNWSKGPPRPLLRWLCGEKSDLWLQYINWRHDGPSSVNQRTALTSPIVNGAILGE